MPNTIESVIRINGGQKVPDTLYSRELFITPDGKLYVGGIDTETGVDLDSPETVAVTVECADTSTTLKNSASSGTFIQLPGFTYGAENSSRGTAKFSNQSSIVGATATSQTSYSSLQRFNIKDCSIDLEGLKFGTTKTKDVLTVSKAKFDTSVTLDGSVFIGSKNYGLDLPTTGTSGQIFFKIVKTVE